ncbi:MAG: PAS domain S-box protein [Thermomicrobiales bacterium]
MPETQSRSRFDLSAIGLSSPEPIIGETPEGVITFWNPAAERLYGYTAGEAIGQPAALLAPAGQAAEVAALRRRVLQGEVIEAYPTVRQARDGRLLDVALTLFPVRDAAGAIIGASNITRSIPQSQRGAAALAASERQFRAAFEAAPTGMALVGLQGELLRVNRAGCELAGYSEEDLLQMSVASILHPEDLAAERLAVEQVIRDGGPGYNNALRIVHRDGSLRWIRLHSALVRDEDGEPFGAVVQVQDLTEEVISREKLAEARQQMQEVLERVGGAFLAVDRDWRITQVNARAEDLIGVPRAALLGKVLQEAVDPELLEPLLDALRTAMTARQRMQIAAFAYAPRNAWYSLRAYPIAEGVSLFIQDITSLHGLEQELRLAELRFQALVEHLPAAVYMVADDADETLMYLSPYFEDLTGFSIERDKPLRDAQAWLELIHPDDREHVVHKGEAFDFQANQVAMEYRLCRADGSYIWVSDAYSAMLDDAGQVVAWQGVIIDISASKVARDAVAELAAIVEASEDAICSQTLEGIITYWNPAAERLYGYTAAEAVGQSLTMLFPHPEETDAPHRDLSTFRSDGPERFVAKQRRKDGSLVDVAITRFPIRSSGGDITGTTGIARDISGLIAAEQALRAALEAAEAGVRAKGLFLAMMSHELRTPLQAVLGYADLLLGAGSGRLSREQREDIGYIRQGASRMVTLIEQLLDLSRMEAGRLDLRREGVEVGAVLEAVRQDGAAGGGEGAAAGGAGGGAGRAGVGDGERVRQIVLNLAGNAVKFTEAGRWCRRAGAAGVGRLRCGTRGSGLTRRSCRRFSRSFGRWTAP